MKKRIKNRLKAASTVAVAVALATSIGAVPFAVAAESAGALIAERTTSGFTTSYGSFDDVLHAGHDLNEQIAGEGFVLLKNKGAALPLATSERSVTLLGAESYQMQTGGGGSGTTARPGSRANSWISTTASTIASSLTDAGFTINSDVSTLHGSGAGANGDQNTYMTATTGDGVVSFGGTNYELPDADFYASATSTLSTYGDAAIINLSRGGAEAEDSATHGAAGHADTAEHYLQLNDSERQILAYAKYQKAQGNFDKIIVIVNSPSVMELGDIEDDDAFDAMLWVGVTGWNGADAIGKILTGEINPSGRTVDFWMRDVKTDPTWYNFGNYSQAAWELLGKYEVSESEPGTNVGLIFEMGQPTEGAPKAPSMEKDINSVLTNNANAVSYSEGIFMGYRYYETVAADIGGDAGEAWYDSVTLYPFGHGLSYTSFTQEITGIAGDLSDADGQITVSVKVTNTGSVAGKDVVQLYSTPEYVDGEIDKAAVNLVGFGKTEVIQPGADVTVPVKIDVKEFSSFDYNDANGNGNAGYELEAGDYVLTLRNNSHDVLDTETLDATALLTWDEDGDPSTPNNIYSQEDGKWEMFNTSASHWTQSGADHDLHRDSLLNAAGDGPSDLKELTWLLTSDNVFTDEAFSVLRMRERHTVDQDHDDPTTTTAETDYENLWVKTAADMAGRTQGAGKADGDGHYETMLSDMYGVAYDDPRWETFIDQLTWTELDDLINRGNYYTYEVNSIGKQRSSDSDGPNQFGRNVQSAFGGGTRGWGWVGEVVISSTWNTELAYEQGKVVGSETLLHPAEAGAGWYGPAMNIHRSPLSGRNFEYYGQDGFQSGMMAAYVVKGAVEQGARVYLKHAFLNDQETSRTDSCVLVNEQALRQTYAKPFEMAVKLGNANGMMLSFNNIGLTSSSSYATCVQLYSNEWGYKGINVTDFWMDYAAPGWDSYNMVRGLCFPLTGFNDNGLAAAYKVNAVWDATDNVLKVDGEPSYTQWYWVRETAKRLLYTHINSNAGAQGFNADRMIGASDNVAVDAAALDGVFGAGNYDVTIGALTDGLTYDATTHAISGETFGAGFVPVSVVGKNGYAWINGSSTADVVVDGEAEYTIGGSANNVPAPAFFGLVADGDAQNYWASGTASASTWNNGNGYIGAISYSATGLPSGFSIDAATGVISADATAVTVPDKYEITITSTVNHVTRTAGQWGMMRYGTESISAESKLTLDVKAAFSVTLNTFGGGTVTLGYGDENLTVAQLLASDDFAAIKGPGIGVTPGGVALTADGEALDSAAAVTDGDELYVVWDYPPVTVIDGTWWIEGVDTEIPVNVKGDTGSTGATGVGISGVEKVSSDGLVDTYRITMSDGTHFDFTVNNGAVGTDGAAGEKGEKGASTGAGAAIGLGVTGLVLGAGALGLALFMFIDKRKGKGKAE